MKAAVGHLVINMWSGCSELEDTAVIALDPRLCLTGQGRRGPVELMSPVPPADQAAVLAPFPSTVDGARSALHLRTSGLCLGFFLPNHFSSQRT